MSLLDRIKGKSSFELLIMDIGDAIHTLKKKQTEGNDTQFAYTIEVLEARHKDLMKINEHKEDLGAVLGIFQEQS